MSAKGVFLLAGAFFGNLIEMSGESPKRPGHTFNEARTRSIVRKQTVKQIRNRSAPKGIRVNETRSDIAATKSGSIV